LGKGPPALAGSIPATPVMADRVRIGDGNGKDENEGGRYFPPEQTVERIPSGCRLLDCSLGGGWPKRRVINIVGDSSSGKTLLAIEMCANFAHKFPNGKIRYRDREEAFDVGYATSIGFPEERVDFGDPSVETVEGLEQDITAFCDELDGEPGLYVVDSLDAFTDEQEKKRDEDGKGSYGTGKAKQMSALFRKCVGKMAKMDVTLVIISQTRDNINASFGEKHTRSGGRALQFYSYVVVWLAHLGKIKATRKGVERTVGVSIKANPKKNKGGPPFRDVEFPIYFNFGVDDVRAGLEWLNEVGRLDAMELGDAVEVEAKKKEYGKKDKQKKTAALSRLIGQLDEMGDGEYRALRKRLNKAIKKVWAEVEARFAPKRRKYE
jgi:protein RecA